MEYAANLPAYLRMAANAQPRPGSTFTSGDFRFTVITPCLIRIEQGSFTDAATTTVLSRAFGTCQAACTTEAGVTLLETGMLTLRHDPALPPEEGLTILRREKPAFLWHFGEKPLHNLGGTTSTLDGVDGACPIGDGVCALDGYALLCDSQSPLLREDGWFEDRKPGLDVYFFGYGHDYTAAVKDFYRLTGAPGLLPAWALGNWWSRYHAYTDAEYLTLMDRFRQRDVPLSVGIVDMDWHLTDGDGRDYWHDGWTGYTWNEKLFPDYKGFIAALHERGLHTALNLHPSSGVRSHEKQYPEMAQRMGIDPESGKPVAFDWLDPDFWKAYFEVLHFPYEADGIDFWWMDWQQGSDHAAITGGKAPKGPLAITPLWMLNHMHYLAAQRNGARPMIFSRFAGPGSQRWPIGFSGDTYITWESLRFQPYFTATASNIGYSWWSHDIGGHMGGYRDDELTVRWIQLGVFSPIFRLHSSESIFLGREPWNYNRRAQLIIEDMMRLRHRLFPYLYTMCRRNAEELVPLVRPMYHTHPEASESYSVPGQYWFGSQLVAAPITQKADSSDLGSADLWLPRGVWTDFFTGTVYKGGQKLKVYRPMEEMPLMMKAGALIPMQAHVPGSRKLGLAEQMELHIAPGGDGEFVLYEDDGETFAYKQGAYAQTRLTMAWQPTAAAVTIHPVEGQAGLVPVRDWRIVLHGFRKGTEVLWDGESLPVEYDEESSLLTVTLQEVEPERGVKLLLRHEAALTHDNSDCREMIVAKLTRAQNSQREKAHLLEAADKLLAKRKNGERVVPWDSGVAECPSLSGYMMELILQV